MSSFKNAMEEPAPPYEELQATNTFNSEVSKTPSFQTPTPLLPQHLADTRTQRINSILSTYVDTLLFSQGAAGLYKTTFVLVPSTVSSLQDSVSNSFTTPREPQVMGFPADETVKLILLQGEEHSMEFWRQPAVVAELESSMKARLSSAGHKIYEESEVEDDKPQPSPTTKSKQKKSFWGRLRTTTDDEIIDRKLGWRAEEPRIESPSTKIPTGIVKVSVLWNDMVLRLDNDMGLFETKKVSALCISVEVGT